MHSGGGDRPATRGVSHVAMVGIPDGLGYYSHSHLPMVRIKTIRSQMTIATSPEVPLGRWLWRFGTSSREVAMVVWDLMACPFFEPSGTTTIATVKVAMMGHPDHWSVSGGDTLDFGPRILARASSPKGFRF